MRIACASARGSSCGCRTTYRDGSPLDRPTDGSVSRPPAPALSKGSPGRRCVSVDKIRLPFSDPIFFSWETTIYGTLACALWFLGV